MVGLLKFYLFCSNRSYPPEVSKLVHLLQILSLPSGRKFISRLCVLFFLETSSILSYRSGRSLVKILRQFGVPTLLLLVTSDNRNKTDGLCTVISMKLRAQNSFDNIVLILQNESRHCLFIHIHQSHDVIGSVILIVRL